MARTSPALTPKSRARKRNRDRQRRFRARKRLRLEDEANDQRLAAMQQPLEPFPWSSSGASSSEDNTQEAVGPRPVQQQETTAVQRPIQVAAISHRNTTAQLHPMQAQSNNGQPNFATRVARDCNVARVVPEVEDVQPEDNAMELPNAQLHEAAQNEWKDGTWLARALTKIRCFGDISETSMEKVTKLFLENIDDISAIHQRGEISSSYRHTIKKRLNIWQPGFKCAVKYQDLDKPDEDPLYVDNLKAIPKKYINPTLKHHYRLLRTEAYTNLADIKRHYEETHPARRGEELKNTYSKASIGIDGVREANSGSRTLYVVSIMFSGCVFLWRIYNPYKSCQGAKPTLAEMLNPIIDEILADADVKLHHIIADMLERHHLRGMVSHSGFHGCEFCLAEGKGKDGGIDYAFATNYGVTLRTKEAWKQVAEKIRDEVPVRGQGITAYSPLLNLYPQFDIVQDLPIDEFHNIKEGIVKLAMTRLLRKNAISTQILKRFNKNYLAMRTFKDSPRQTRSLNNLPDFKGTEYALLVFSALPCLIKQGMRDVPATWKKRKQVLAMLCFFTRLYNYNDDTLTTVEATVNLESLHQRFYKTFEKAFCKGELKANKVPPNVHLFSHLLDCRRRNGPLWQYSTEPFESLYAVVRRSFQTGTRNTPLQIMQNCYLRSSVGHRCRDQFKMRVAPDTSKSAKFADNWISTTDGKWWEVTEDVGNDTFLSYPIITAKMSTRAIGLALPWEKIGVKRFLRVDKGSPPVPIQRVHVRGKLMLCGGYASEWLPQWYRDSRINY